MLFMKRKQSKNGSIYLKPPQQLTASNEDIDSFSLPTFDEEPIRKQIIARTETLAAKIAKGDLDGQNYDFIPLAYTAIMNELEAELGAYQAQCTLELQRLQYSLEDQARIHTMLLEDSSAIVHKLCEAE